MSVEQERYVPSKEELKDASEHLTPAQAELSKRRSRYYEEFAITDPEITRDAANLVIKEDEDENNPQNSVYSLSGRLAGHQVDFIARWEDTKGPVHNVKIDSVDAGVSNEVVRQLFEKYNSFKRAVDKEESEPTPPGMTDEELLIHKLLKG